MLMQSQRNQGTGNSLPGCAGRVSKTYPNRARWASSLIMTIIAGGILASCRASDITAPAFEQKSPKPNPKPSMEATVINPTKVEIPAPTAIVNPCDPLTTLVVDAKTTVSMHSTQNFNSFHVYMSTSTKGRATDPNTGVTWIVDTDNFQEMEVAAGSETTKEQDQLYVSQGPPPNWLMHWLMHVTVNPAGVVTAKADNFKAGCKG